MNARKIIQCWGFSWRTLFKAILTRGQKNIIHKDSAKTDIAWDLRKKQLESICSTLIPRPASIIQLEHTPLLPKLCYAYTIFLDLFCCLVKVFEFAANSTPEAQMGIKSTLSLSILFHIMFSTIFKLYSLSSCMTWLFPLGDYFAYTQNPNTPCACSCI